MRLGFALTPSDARSPVRPHCRSADEGFPNFGPVRRSTPRASVRKREKIGGTHPFILPDFENHRSGDENGTNSVGIGLTFEEICLPVSTSVRPAAERPTPIPAPEVRKNFNFFVNFYEN
jgi:hypothetical protein